MDRVTSAGLCGRDYLFDVQVSRHSGSVQTARLVRLARVQRSSIVFGEDSYRCNPHVSRRTCDTDGDLASICNQKTLRHHAIVEITFIGAALTLPSFSRAPGANFVGSVAFRLDRPIRHS
jgi:hypothetical protein